MSSTVRSTTAADGCGVRAAEGPRTRAEPVEQDAHRDGARRAYATICGIGTPCTSVSRMSRPL